MRLRHVLLCLSLLLSAGSAAAAEEMPPVDFQWGVRIPLRDGTRLNATLYRPHAQREALPCILTLTPYVAQRFHREGTYFAANGYVFAAVDVRGRGNSEGEFTPLLQEANDGSDTVEWLARQPWCNGKVGMWGGSYGGYDQWAAAKERPPYLATIVPVASPKPGVDFPPQAGGGIHSFYDIMWITLVSGRAAQDAIFVDDSGFWSAKAREWFAGMRPFKELDVVVGNPSALFRNWAAHPIGDPWWKQYVPDSADYARIELPILTITGQYDGNQAGALSFYREHMAAAMPTAQDKHYLIIGPWDHAGTRNPTEEYAGLEFGTASLVDMHRLHKDWYDWTLKGAPRPDFLKDRVAYYVLGDGAGEWRYAHSLERITTPTRAMYLSSRGGRANAVFASGSLDAAMPTLRATEPDRYRYDPSDTAFQAWDDPWDSPHGLTSQAGLLGADGRILFYHTPAFTEDVELIGFPSLRAWLGIDQRDTDFAASLYEIRADGSSILIGSDALRARYRHGLDKPELVSRGTVERYEFKGFPFVARRIPKGSRLRLAFGPMNSKYAEKNYNSGGSVADESGRDAHVVSVSLHHDAEHPSALYLPIAEVAFRH